MSTAAGEGTQMADLLLHGATIVTMNPDRHVLSPGYVAVTEGRVVAVGAGDPPPLPARATRDLTGQTLLPGFVNTHDHLVSVLTRGLGGDRFQTGGDPEGRALAAAIRSSFDEATCYAGARLALSELMLSGVTTTTDSQAARRGLEDGSDGTLRAMTESRMRGVFFRASVNRTEMVPTPQHDDEELAASELDRLRSRWASGRVRVGAEAMALHRVSPELLKRLHEWSGSNDAPFAMHISYSEMAAQYPIDEYGDRLMRVLAKWEVLDDRFLGYHPVWLDQAEIETLTGRGGGAALCSAANMLIGAAAAPLTELISADVRLGLGTDQPNDGHNFFEVMKATVLHQRAASQGTEIGSPELALELATIGGARALHREDEIGSIEVGKQADLVVMAAERASAVPSQSLISNLVYAASPADVDSVIIGGDHVVRHGELLPWDVGEVASEADRVVRLALANNGLDETLLTSWPVIQG